MALREEGYKAQKLLLLQRGIAVAEYALIMNVCVSALSANRS